MKLALHFIGQVFNPRNIFRSYRAGRASHGGKRPVFALSSFRLRQDYAATSRLGSLLMVPERHVMEKLSNGYYELCIMLSLTMKTRLITWQTPHSHHPRLSKKN